MTRWLLVLAAGCNQIYDLQPTRTRDGGTIADPDDVDSDGVADAVDNCRTIANGDQADVDSDGTGDICDNCALVPNEQESDADGDGLGDLCDPHPSAVGDCLLLVDTFADASKFGELWKSGGTGTVTPRTGDVRIEPVAGKPDVLLQPQAAFGATDMFVRGTADTRSAGVTAVIAASATALPYECVLSGQTIAIDGPSTSIPTVGKLVPGETVNLTFVTRLLTTPRSTDTVDVSCRADYGISIATAVSQGEPLVTGEPRITISTAPVTIDAIVLLRFQPSKPCPATIYR